MLEYLFEDKETATKDRPVQPLDISQVKKGDTVEVYRIDQGFVDATIFRLSRIKGYIKTVYEDGYWEPHWNFWVAGSHRSE